jgi:hypothetical protein
MAAAYWRRPTFVIGAVRKEITERRAEGATGMDKT